MIPKYIFVNRFKMTCNKHEWVEDIPLFTKNETVWYTAGSGISQGAEAIPGRRKKNVLGSR